MCWCLGVRMTGRGNLTETIPINDLYATYTRHNGWCVCNYIYMDFLTVKEIAQGHERMEKSPLISAPIKKYRVANKKKKFGWRVLVGTSALVCSSVVKVVRVRET